MNKAQRSAFLRYLTEAGATVENVQEDAHGYLTLRPSLTVTGAGLHVAFTDAYGHLETPWTAPDLAHALPAAAPTFDRGPRPVMTTRDHWRDFTHAHMSRLTTSGAYRFTVKEETIRRSAAPLRALAASFAALQRDAVPPARTWTPDHLDAFARRVHAALNDTRPPDPASPLELALWASMTPHQVRTLHALRDAAQACAAALRSGVQPSDPDARTFDHAARAFDEAHQEEDAHTLDATP